MSKIRVQMPLGTGSISVAGHSYQANEEGIVHLDHAEHVSPLVAAGGVEINENDQAGPVSGLMGTESLPATIDLGSRGEVSLGDIVRETFAKTQLGVDEWNNLPPRIRDTLLGYQIGTQRGEIGDIRTERARIEELEVHQAELEGQLDSALRAATPPQTDTDTTDKPTMPEFAGMTKAKINEWLVENGAEPLQSGNLTEHTTRAEARWAELHPAV